MIALRAARRFGLAGIAIVVAALVCVQFERIVARNVAVASDLAHLRGDVAALEGRRARDLRDIRRLSDPAGAIPEIHDRLHLVGSHEELIFIHGARGSRSDDGAAAPDGAPPAEDAR